MPWFYEQLSHLDTWLAFVVVAFLLRPWLWAALSFVVRQIRARQAAQQPKSAEEKREPPKQVAPPVVAQPAAQPLRSAPVLVEAERLPLREWTRRLNDQPDAIPHVMIVGPTGSGKTTMAVALLAGRADQVIVLTPKLKPDDWVGLPVVSLVGEGSYSQLAAAVSNIEDERRLRCVALASGALIEPLTIVLDEVPDLVDEVEGVGDLIRKLSQMGRDLKMRVIGLSTSGLVEDWGMKGRGAARRNFARVELPPVEEGKPRVGRLLWADEVLLDLSGVKRFTEGANLVARGWTGGLPKALLLEKQRLPYDMDDEMQLGAVATPVTTLREERAPFARRTSDNPDVGAVGNEVVSPDEVARIASLLTKGVAPSDVAKSLPGYDPRQYKRFKARVDQVAEMLEKVDASSI